MKTKGIIALTIATLLSMSSCVTNKKYAALESEYQTAKNGLIECNSNTKVLESQLEGLKEQNKELKSGLGSLKSSLDQAMNNNAQGNVNISKLVDEINASNKYIKELVAAKSKSDSLNMVLTNNLTRSLNSEELKDVNVKVLKGVVYISLNDNMLYKSGSYRDQSGCNGYPEQDRQDHQGLQGL